MIVERLKNLRNASKMSQKDFAQSLKVSQQTVASWERGRTEPSNVALKDIADYFNVTTDYLLGRDSKVSALSKKQTDLLGMFDGLNEEGQNALMVMLNSLKVSHARQKSKTASVVQKNLGGINNLAVNGNIYNK